MWAQLARSMSGFQLADNQFRTSWRSSSSVKRRSPPHAGGTPTPSLLLSLSPARVTGSSSDLLQVAFPVPRRAAQQLGVAAGAAQIQVRRMLPGESDAAVYLDAGRRDEDEGVRAIRLCQSKIGLA